MKEARINTESPKSNARRPLFRRRRDVTCHSPLAASGFTLVELMVTVAIVAAATGVAYITFSTVIVSWRKGVAVTEALHHGDFVLDQLAMGLRSAYFPEKYGPHKTYGFWHEDNGSEDFARDSICWVKQGLALTGPETEEASGLHRTRFTVEDDDNGELGACVRIWHIGSVLPDDFDVELVEPTFLSSSVIAFDCRMATNMIDGEWEWEDMWDEEITNILPEAVELTVYMRPFEEGGYPVVMRRCVEIPVSPLAWPKQKN